MGNIIKVIGDQTQDVNYILDLSSNNIHSNNDNDNLPFNLVLLKDISYRIYPEINNPAYQFIDTNNTPTTDNPKLIEIRVVQSFITPNPMINKLDDYAGGADTTGVLHLQVITVITPKVKVYLYLRINLAKYSCSI